MSGASTGQFWICPKCQRHVPHSLETCRCGAHRTASHSVAVVQRASAASNAWLGWACAALLLGYLVYDRSSRESSPKAVAMRPAAVAVPTSQGAVPASQPDPSLVAAEQAAAEKAWAELGKSTMESPTAEIAVPAPSVPLAAPAVVTQPQLPPAQPEYVPEEKTERYWKQRLFQSRDRIRTAFDACTSQYHAGGIGDYGNTQYAAVRGSLVSAISGQNQLEEEARQAGVAPGWVRFDWTPYPRMSITDPASQTGTLTNVHPCSVPHIRDSLGLR